MPSFIDIVDQISEYTGRVISWLAVFMACLLFLVVILRYGFNFGWIWMQEIVTYSHAIFFMMAAAFTLKEDGHVRIDVIYRTASPKYKLRLNQIGSIIFLLPTCSFIFYFSFGYVIDSWSYLESSRESGGLPIVFILKSVILLFSFSLLLQCLAEITRNTIKLRGLK